MNEDFIKVDAWFGLNYCTNNLVANTATGADSLVAYLQNGEDQ